MAVQRNKPGAPPAQKTYTHKPPDFAKLKEGDTLKGIFLGTTQTQYGIAYKIRNADGVVKTLGGNRFQLDSIFEEMMADTEAFGEHGLKGHLIEVRRLPGNVTTKSGRTVGRYEVAHIFEGCPLGCQPF